MGSVTELGRNPIPAYVAPAALSPEHDLAAFSCGKVALDDWLRQRAQKSEGSSARTYVVCSGRTVVGYYCLATGGTRHNEVSAKIRRNMPNPIPMMVVGRLAVDTRHAGRGIGSGLLRDAMRRAVEVHRIAGFRAIAVHAKDDEALAFYIRYGFVEYPLGTRTLFLPIETIVAAL